MSTPRVLVTRQLPEGALDPLEGYELVGPLPEDTPLRHDDLVAAVRDVDAVVCVLTDPIDAEVIRAGVPRLRVVATVSVGYDNVDVAAATEAGVVVANTPGVLDETTADLTWALVLMASRRASEAERDLRSGRWQGWALTQYLGRDVHGATLGIVGYGRIGRAVARRASGFAMRVLHHCRTPTGEEGYVAALDDLLAAADVVTLHVPLTDATRHLVGARELALMKPTAVLVNTSRGPVVDEAALARALEDGRIFAAGLDVYEHEPAVHPGLAASPRATLLPHIGSASVTTRTRMARMAAEAVRSVLSGARPPNAVNAP